MLSLAVFQLIVHATYSELHVCSKPGRECLARCLLYSQFSYFQYCFALFLHSRYLATAKLVSLPKTEKLMNSSTSNIFSQHCVSCYILFILFT